MNSKVIKIKKKELKIRRLQRKDKERFWEYFQALSERTKEFFRPHPFDKETAEKLCEENDPNVARFITVEKINCKEKVIGYSFLWNLNQDFPSLGIGIRDDYQGIGLGKVLINHLIETGKSLKKKGLTLTVVKENKSALSLYSKLGFKIEKEFYEKKDNHWFYAMKLLFKEV